MIPSLERLPKVQLHHLAEPPSWLRHFPFIIIAPFKIFHQILTILVVLIVDIEEAPEFLLVQVSEVMMSQHGLLLPCALRNVSPTHMWSGIPESLPPRRRAGGGEGEQATHDARRA